MLKMPNIIQTKSQTLELDTKKKNRKFTKIQLYDNLNNLDIKRSGNKPFFFFSSSSSYGNSYSDDNDLPIGADRQYMKETHASKYHTFSEGSFKHIDKVQYNQIHSVKPALPPLPNINTIENEENKKKFKYSQNNKKESNYSEAKEEFSDNTKLNNTEGQFIPTITISPDDEIHTELDFGESEEEEEYDDDDNSGETYDSLLDYSSEDDDDEDQVVQYNHLNPPQIHIAVRRDASLFKIEKISRENMAPAFNLAEVPKISNLTQKAEIDNDHNWVFSIPEQKKDQVLVASTGMFTPPESPEYQYNSYDNKLDQASTENINHGLVNEVCFTHVQKKAHRSLKNFITGTYQLNHLTVTKVNSSISPYPGLHSAIHNTSRKSKLLLKVIIVSLTEEASEEQKRFGFTFWWQKSARSQEQRFKDDAKFAIAPDSLVKESLVTWIDSQGEGIQLPCLSKADSIMRDGKKIYVVYDPSLFLV